MKEAKLESAGSGLAPVTEGWFVVNVRDAEWFSSDTRGAACWFANEYGESPVEAVLVTATLGLEAFAVAVRRHSRTLAQPSAVTLAAYPARR